MGISHLDGNKELTTWLLKCASLSGNEHVIMFAE